VPPAGLEPTDAARRLTRSRRGVIVATGTGLVPAVNALVQVSRKLNWAALNKLLAAPLMARRDFAG
jgi:hypothetical protein